MTYLGFWPDEEAFLEEQTAHVALGRCLVEDDDAALVERINAELGLQAHDLEEAEWLLGWLIQRGPAPVEVRVRAILDGDEEAQRRVREGEARIARARWWLRELRNRRRANPEGWAAW